MWKITNTTNGKHIGVLVPSVETNQVMTFADGDVVVINQVFTADEGRTLLGCGVNYQITFIKEE